MDVRCPSCGTDYELDDARVPDTGLPVKCSKCGHVFRAVRPAPGSGEPARVVTGIHSAATEWMIRRTSGEMVRFRELTTLQRWIVERKVSRNDEISKTGKKWEKLGNIPELAIFFQVIESQPPGTAAADAPTDALPSVPATDDGPPSSWANNPPPAIATPVKPAWPVDKPWSPLQGAAGVPPPPPMATDPGRPAAPPRIGPDPLSETLPDPTGVNPVVMNVARPDVPLTHQPEPGEQRHETVRWDMSPNLPEEVREEYEVDASRPGREATPPPKKRSHLGQYAFAAIAVVVGLLAVSYVLRPAWLTSLYRHYIAGVPPAAIRSVEDAYAALLLDTGASIGTAVEKLEAALGLDASYAPARAGLAEALAARADLERDLADQRGAMLAANPVAEPAPELAAVAELRQKADADLQRAKVEATQALEIDAASLASNRAMLEIVRMSGERQRIDQYAIIAHSISPDDIRLNTIMGAVALPEPSAVERAQKTFETVLTKEPKANHARYLLARAQLARGEKDKALATLKELLATTPAHERAAMMVKGLEEPVGGPTEQSPDGREPIADNGVPTADGRVPSPDSRTPNTDGRAPTADTPTPTPTQATGPKAADDPSLTFAEAMARGERLREADKPGQAVRFYERAAALNPKDPDAHLGVGFSRLDLREGVAAIAAFKRAIDISPRFSDAHFGLAEAYRMRGNKLYAIAEYKRYLDIAPHGPDAELARNLLQKLEDDNSDAPLQPQPQPQPPPSQPEPPPAPAPPQ